MEFQDVIRQRKMVRSFSNRAVPEDSLKIILKNMFSGPSAGFSQGTEVLVLQSPQSREAFFSQWGPKQDRKTYRNSWPLLEHAPVIILVCANEAAYTSRYTEADKQRELSAPWWYVDAGMASLLGLLTTVDQDLVATFTGVKDQSYLRSEFGIPEEFEAVGAILLGYQKGDYRPSSSVSRGRRPMDEVVHKETW